MRNTIRKLLSLMLVIAMAMMSIPALAETATEAPAEDVAAAPASALVAMPSFTMEQFYQVNPDTLKALISQFMPAGEGNEEAVAQTEKMLDLVAALISNLQPRLEYAGGAAKAEVKLKDQSLLDLGIQMDESGLQVSSSLIPTKVISVDPSFLQQAIASSGINQEALASVGQSLGSALMAIMPHAQQLMTTIAGKFSEPETGVWTFEGSDFSQRRFLDMTTRELLTELLTFVKNVQEAEEVKALIESLKNIPGLNVSVTPMDVESAMAKLEGTPDDQLPKIALYLYGNDPQEGVPASTFVDLTVEQDDKQITAQFGQITDKIIINLNYPEQAQISVNINQAEKHAVLDLDINARIGEQVVPLCTNVEFRVSDTGIEEHTLVRANDAELLMSDVLVNIVPDLKVEIDNEGKTVLTMEDLTKQPAEDETSSMTPAQSLGMEAMMGLFGIINKVQQAMPEEAETLNQVLQMMGMPGASANP